MSDPKTIPAERSKIVDRMKRLAANYRFWRRRKSSALERRDEYMRADVLALREHAEALR